MSTSAPRVPFPPPTGPDWASIKATCISGNESVRATAKRYGVTHAAILKRAKAEGWGLRSNAARRAGTRGVTSNQPKAGNHGAVTQRGNQPGGNQAKAKGKPPEGKILAVIREWQKNWLEIGRVTLEEYNGAILIQVRSWSRDLKTGELRPTKKGVAVTISQVVTEVLPGLNDALAKARELGLYDEGADQ